MNLTVSQTQGRVPVTVIHLEGKLDSNNFQDLIEEARQQFTAGAHSLLLDMTKLTYISSAGIVALQSIAKLFRGESMPDTQAGWQAIRSLEKERTGGVQQHVKLLNVSSDVHNVLEMVGIFAFFETFTDMQQAVDSF